MSDPLERREITTMPRRASLPVWLWRFALAVGVTAATPAAGDGQVETDLSLQRLGLLADPGAGQPATRSWAPGELIAGQSYGGTIAIANLCTAARPVGIFVTGLPNFLIPLEATIPASGQVELPYLIDVPAGAAGSLTGQIAVWAPAGSGPGCSATRVAFAVDAFVVGKVGEEWGKTSPRDSTTPDVSGLDRRDPYDYDGDGDVNEPDGYIDPPAPLPNEEGHRGFSPLYYFRLIEGGRYQAIEARRLQAAAASFSSKVLTVDASSGVAPSLEVTTPTTPVPPRDDSVVAGVRRFFVRKFAEAAAVPFDIAGAAVNPESAATADVDPAAQSVLSVMEEAGVFVSHEPPKPRRRLAGWWRPAAPRFSIASVSPRAGGDDDPQKPAAASAAAAPDDLLIYFTSTGPLGAGAFRAVLVNGTGARIAVGKSVAVLEPVARLTARDVERELKTLSHLPQRAVTLDGYCLERLKAPPVAGMVFRLAAPAGRARYATAERVLDSASRLREQKAFTPDVDPAEYQQSITQWAIWADRERFDEKAFGAAFAAYTKKNVTAAGAKWTREMDAAVAEIVPNRWRDIDRIVQYARNPRGVH